MITAEKSDWAEWSRETVRLMQERNDALILNYGLQNAGYKWCLDCAEIVFDTHDAVTAASLSVIGTLSKAEQTFLWSWANEALPAPARRGMEKVRAFGENNQLDMLMTSEWESDLSQALEAAAIAGRILDAFGVWTEEAGDVTLFFALSDIKRRMRCAP